VKLTHRWWIRIDQKTSSCYIHGKGFVICRQFLQMIGVGLQIRQKYVLFFINLNLSTKTKNFLLLTHIVLPSQTKLCRGVQEIHQHARRTVQNHSSFASDAFPHHPEVIVLLELPHPHHIIVNLTQLQKILQASCSLSCRN